MNNIEMNKEDELEEECRHERTRTIYHAMLGEVVEEPLCDECLDCGERF
jgi:hypothetical protein